MESTRQQEVGSDPASGEPSSAQPASPNTISQDTLTQTTQAQLFEGGHQLSSVGSASSVPEPLQTTRSASPEPTGDPNEPAIAVVSFPGFAINLSLGSLLSNVILG